ncbi:hypothetical protein D3C75_980830 [compost metagenome]
MNGLTNHRLIVKDDTASPSFYGMKRRFPAGRMQRKTRKFHINRTYYAALADECQNSELPYNPRGLRYVR